MRCESDKGRLLEAFDGVTLWAAAKVAAASEAHRIAGRMSAGAELPRRRAVWGDGGGGEEEEVEEEELTAEEEDKGYVRGGTGDKMGCAFVVSWKAIWAEE